MRLLIALGICVAMNVNAANKFVRPSYGAGTHSGDDWNNAYNDAAGTTQTVSNTYIWAGGTYTSSPSITANYTTFRRARATNSVDSAAAGWSAGFDSQPVFPGITVGGTIGVTVDGVVPYNGILATNLTTGDDYAVDLGTASVSNFTLINVLMDGKGLNDGAGEQRCYNSTGTTPNPRRLNNRIAYCTLRNAATCMNTFYEEGFIFEHNVLEKNNTADTALHHPNLWQAVGCSNVTVRYNRITDWDNEGIMLDFSDPSDARNGVWWIYGNLVYDARSGSSRFVESQYNSNGPVYIFNNTIVDLPTLCISTANDGTWHSDCAVTNNILFNVNGNHTFGNGKANYNLTDDGSEVGANSIAGATSAIFTDYSGQDYTIVTNIGALFPRNKGIDLGSTYATDFAGNPRGDDGTWDIGAYEAEGDGPEPPATPEDLCCIR